jgi:hypothetical protein
MEAFTFYWLAAETTDTSFPLYRGAKVGNGAIQRKFLAKKK